VRVIRICLRFLVARLRERRNGNSSFYNKKMWRRKRNGQRRKKQLQHREANGHRGTLCRGTHLKQNVEICMKRESRGCRLGTYEILSQGTVWRVRVGN
jgi:hypothetical protein